MTASLLLVHGGLWDAMDADAFWGTTGVLDGLRAATAPDLQVLAPDRPRCAHGWEAEVDALAEHLPKPGPATVVGASNGCTTAVLLALRFPALVDRLLLAWPATGSDPVANERARAGMVKRGCPPAVADEMITGGVLRGATDEQLASLERITVAVLPAVPENPSHQRITVDGLLRVIRGSRELAGGPEPPTPAFRDPSGPPHLDQLVRTIVEFVD
jgi:pimeloyl-ACP methyl ester carboxylesterase